MEVRKILLGCGVLSSLLYVATDALASVRYKGYSYTSQAVSELGAAGAPTRSLWMLISVPYNVLLTTLGVGIWLSARRKRAARPAGAFLIASAVVGQVTPVFFPMDQRGAKETPRGRLHGPLTAVASLFILLTMGFGAALHGRRFRSYSVGTMITLVVFGGLAAAYVPRMVAQKPTPLLGVVERINIYAYLLWVAVLAASLLGVKDARDNSEAHGDPATRSPVG